MRVLACLLSAALAVPTVALAQPPDDPAPAEQPAPAPATTTPADRDADRRSTRARRVDEDPISYDEALADGYAERPPEELPGSLAASLLALGPGIVVHGIGHFSQDETRTGVILLLTEVTALLFLLGGAFAESLTNDSASVATATDALSHVGTVLFVGSWLADVIGSYTGTVPYDPDTTRVEGSVFGVAYRYNDSPLDDLRHHLVARLSVDFGHVYIRPELDLEAGLQARRASLDLGFRLLRGADPHEHLALGVLAHRREDEPNGFATSGLETYLWGKADLGDVMRTLRHVYVAGRVGYGIDGYQFTDTGTAPPFFSEVGFTDSRILLQSGVGFNTGERTHMLVLWSNDTISDVPPDQVYGQVDVQLQHRYLDAVDIDVQLTLGDGFAIRLGLGYAL